MSPFMPASENDQPRIDRDPISVYQRKIRAARRAGENARCNCGEQNPDALITAKPTICFECKNRSEGKKRNENHHVAGKANSPITMSTPANIHRALSMDQIDWPVETLRNPSGNQLLKIAGSIRGFLDTHDRLVNALIRPLPELLEKLAENQTREAGDE